ncbi:AMP-binding protein [candidate division KSB1 bacterium]|nr:AMP-binding protein [candidate division KSB1 bacterium]
MQKFEKLTLKEVLKKSAELYPKRPALALVDGAPITYEELRQYVDEVSHFMQQEGIGKGDRVAILSESKPNWGIAYFAVTTLGAVAVPILPDFHQSAVQHIIRHSKCKAIFISKKQYEKIEDCRFEALKTVILIDDFQLIEPNMSKAKLEEALQNGIREILKIRDVALRLTGRKENDVEEEDTAAVIYTSGTTGHSKGVMLTHKNIVWTAQTTRSIVKITEVDRLLSILPLSHTYECTLGFVIPIMSGACIYYLDKPPTPRLLVQSLQNIKPTMMLSVPLVIEKIYKTRIAPELRKNTIVRTLSKSSLILKRLHKIAGKKLMKTFGGELHFFGVGGAALSPEVEKFLREAEFPYSIGYGLTETSPLIAGTDAAHTRYRSTGPPIPGVEVKIGNPDEKTGEGEILVKGPNVMKGYFKDSERTKEVFTEDGYFRTGDLGVVDEDGYLYIKGRLKNMILGPSGENIYPEEIEAIINDQDCVLESIVFQQQEKLVARVFLNYEKLDEDFSTKNFSETRMSREIQKLLENCRKNVNENVPAFARLSRFIEQQEPFEKTPTQKIKRYLYVEE